MAISASASRVAGDGVGYSSGDTGLFESSGIDIECVIPEPIR